MPKPPLIRHALPSDLDVIARIEVSAATLFPAGRIPDAEETTPLHELHEAVADGLLWVAEISDEVVGFCIAWQSENRLHLEEVDVLPRFGRRGIGGALINAAVEEARRRKLAEVTLTTFADLAWNAPFYRRIGFEAFNADELPDTLAAILESERQLGMTQRIAMRLPLGTTP